jgi:serine O-acetyltransferase
LWWLSVRAHRRGWDYCARLIKAVNFALNSASLPYEAELAGPVMIWHRGVGTVIHPATRIGLGVRIAHNVTVSAGDWTVDTDTGVIIEDDVTLATGCSIIPRQGSSIRIGRGAIIGAHALITADVPAGAVMGSPRAVVLRVVDEAGSAP